MLIYRRLKTSGRIQNSSLGYEARHTIMLPKHHLCNNQRPAKPTVGSGKWRPPFLSQPYPGTADFCPGGPVLSPQPVGITMENSKSYNKLNL